MEKNIIYYDRNENNKGRASRFNEFLKKLNLTVDKNQFRVTTSNGEFLHWDNYIGVNLEEGDYMYNGVLFEFKSKNDLALSIPERLDKQIDNVLKMKNVNQYIIISDCLKDLDFTRESEREWFENLKNYFLQYIPFHIYFIPCTSEYICFRDMVNIWRCQQSPLNLYTLNHRWELNPFLNNLAILPCLNHNQAKAIFKKYPYEHAWDILKLTKEDIAEVKFGKKRCGLKHAEEIINQIQIRFGNNYSDDLNNIKTHNHLWDPQGGVIWL